jgi:hypothetical protein
MAQKISERRVNEGCWLAGGSEERFLAQADSFADERREKASVCCGRNDRWE